MLSSLRSPELIIPKEVDDMLATVRAYQESCGIIVTMGSTRRQDTHVPYSFLISLEAFILRQFYLQDDLGHEVTRLLQEKLDDPR